MKGLRWLTVTLLSDDERCDLERHHVLVKTLPLNNHSILSSFLKGRHVYSVAVKRVASLGDNHNLQHIVVFFCFLPQIRLLKRESHVGGFRLFAVVLPKVRSRGSGSSVSPDTLQRPPAVFASISAFWMSFVFPPVYFSTLSACLVCSEVNHSRRRDV